MDINNLISSRRTIRKFKQTPVSNECLNKYVQAARLAPSAGNVQSLKYIIVSDEQMRDNVFSTLKWAGYLAPEYNPDKNHRPMAYIIVCNDTNIEKKGYDMDVGAAVENMILSAWDDGVGTCWIGSVNRPVLKKYLDLTDNIYISCVLALGYPDEEPKEVKLSEDGSIKYYLENGTLCVPKRDIDDIIIARY